MALQEGTQLFICFWIFAQIAVFTSFAPWETFGQEGNSRFAKGEAVLFLVMYVQNEINDETMTLYNRHPEESDSP